MARSSTSYVKGVKHPPRTHSMETRAKLSASVKAAWASGKFANVKFPNNLPTDPEYLSAMRRKQIEHEESEANRLRSQGYEVFSPTVVCDRIAVKDGLVFFVEFKRLGQELRPGQKRIQDLVPDRYMVLYSVT